VYFKYLDVLQSHWQGEHNAKCLHVEKMWGASDDTREKYMHKGNSPPTNNTNHTTTTTTTTQRTTTTTTTDDDCTQPQTATTVMSSVVFLYVIGVLDQVRAQLYGFVCMS